MRIQYINAKSGKRGLSFLPSINREIVPSQVTKLVDSIKTMGVIRPLVVSSMNFINGKRKRYIVDGQHLFMALMRLGQNIPYIEVKIRNKVELIHKIALLNASSKNWCMTDYVKAWGHLKSDYVKLRDYFDRFDLEMSIVASILSGNIASSGGAATKMIKNGSFEIVDEVENVKVLEYVADFLTYFPRVNRFESRYLCSEYANYIRKHKRYNHAKFIAVIKKHKRQIIAATTESGALTKLLTKLK